LALICEGEYLDQAREGKKRAKELHNDELHTLIFCVAHRRACRTKGGEEIRGSHGDDCEEYRLLGCSTVCFWFEPTFQGRRVMHIGYWWESQKERDH
jgi:hypothetical protein